MAMYLPAELRLDSLVMVLAGGRGERLYPLTRDRTKAAVPFGGFYRLIDFTLSNCLHSGLRRICILPQHQYAGLKNHLQLGWGFFRPELGESLTLLPPERGSRAGEYRGTADAVYQNLRTLQCQMPRYTVILSSDHIYRLDYRRLIECHAAREAELTIACMGVGMEEAKRFGVLSVDATERVVGFAEKPVSPRALPGRPGLALASLGIYVFNTQVLIDALIEDAACPTSSHDFGADILPRLVDTGRRVYAYDTRQGAAGERFYWRDIGLIDAYWEASMDLLEPTPPFDPHDPSWPTHTHFPFMPPARLLRQAGSSASIANVLACNGSQVVDAHVQRSILSPGVVVEPGAVVIDSVLMEGVKVGRGARVERAVVDEHARIPAGSEIGTDLEQDWQHLFVSPGGVVVVPRGLGPSPARQSPARLGPTEFGRARVAAVGAA
ncbi:MAG: glucose-1-phosphate adenylyltransferase [Candidatus Latescibacteria bacterium]|nr:glucose-1-phosphate adenylyltransferase [Candidatus Latescibacterota bacterium]